MQPLFGELSTIFLGVLPLDLGGLAADAMEMSMDEFHDFVVDVGLETKKYKFDVMCNQFIKVHNRTRLEQGASHTHAASPTALTPLLPLQANATNTAQAYQERMQTATKDRISDADKSLKRKEVKKVKGTNDGKEAKKDQELVLYEFLNMLVRISFWRENPTFGNFGDKSEFVPVPAAIHKTLNEVILPKAKRDTSAQFRDVTMQDSGVKEALKTYNDKLQARDRPTSFTSHTPHLIHTSQSHTPSPLPLQAYYKKIQGGVGEAKLTFDEWLRVLDQQNLVGEWEVEQQSPSPATSRRRARQVPLLDRQREGGLPRLAEQRPGRRRPVVGDRRAQRARL